MGKSAKEYGLNMPEYLDERSPHFLRKGHTLFPHSQVIYQLTEPSEAIVKEGRYEGTGEGYIVGEVEQYSGYFSEMAVHEKKIVWD